MATDEAGPGGASAAARLRTKPESTEPPDNTPRVVTSESLLAGASQLAILHDRTLYFLRQTRYGKLILTK
jgi:hemin uptake protein HemP